MFRAKVLTVCAALALAGAAMVPAGAQNPPKNDRQAGPSGQTPAQLREPDSYRATMVVRVIPTGGSPKITIPPLGFDVAKMGGDRYWSFQWPQVGEVTYLEAGAQKYLILPTRNQYYEVDPSQFDVPLSWALSPEKVIDRIRRQATFERVGSTVINGQRATAYRTSGSAATGSGGRVKNETVVYVGEQSGLPLRAELDNTTTSGLGARVIIETESVDLAPQASLFQLPAGLKKGSSEELKREVNGLLSTLRALYEALSQQQATR
jgi:hypothetical protein